MLNNCYYYVTIYQKRVVLLLAKIVHIFWSNLIFGVSCSGFGFRSLFWFRSGSGSYLLYRLQFWFGCILNRNFTPNKIKFKIYLTFELPGGQNKGKLNQRSRFHVHCHHLEISNFEFFNQINFFSSIFFIWLSLYFAEETKFLRLAVSKIRKYQTWKWFGNIKETKFPSLVISEVKKIWKYRTWKR